MAASMLISAATVPLAFILRNVNLKVGTPSAH